MSFRFPYLGLAFVVLLAAFLLSLAVLNWNPSEMVAVVEGNPQYSLEVVRGMVLYNILPQLVGLGLCIMAFARREKHPITNFGLLLILILSLVSIYLTYSGLRGLSREYDDTILLAHKLNGKSQVDHAILIIYTTIGISGILWAITVMAFITAFMYRTLVSEEAQL